MILAFDLLSVRRRYVITIYFCTHEIAYHFKMVVCGKPIRAINKTVHDLCEMCGLKRYQIEI